MPVFVSAREVPRSVADSTLVSAKLEKKDVVGHKTFADNFIFAGKLRLRR